MELVLKDIHEYLSIGYFVRDILTYKYEPDYVEDAIDKLTKILDVSNLVTKREINKVIQKKSELEFTSDKINERMSQIPNDLHKYYMYVFIQAVLFSFYGEDSKELFHLYGFDAQLEKIEEDNNLDHCGAIWTAEDYLNIIEWNVARYIISGSYPPVEGWEGPAIELRKSLYTSYCGDY